MDLSIIIPVYNSEKIIENLVEKIIFSMKSIKSINSYELIFINDFSSDESWGKIKKLSTEHSFIKGINFKKNFGQHNAIMAGLKESKGQAIITMDDDLQHSPESINKLLDELNKGYDVCYVKYLNRKHKSWKIFVSWANNLVQSYLLNKPYNIYMSSFRAIKKNIVDKILDYKKPYVFIDGLILKNTRNISIIPVQHNKRSIGESNYSFSKLWSLWANISTTFPFSPLRVATIFRIILFVIIFFIRKLLVLLKKDKRTQFEIDETTFKKK